MSLDQLQGDTSQNFIPFPLGRPLGMLQPSPPSVGPYPPSGIASVGGQLPPITSIISGPGGPIFNRPIMPMPIRPGPRLPEMPDYSSQFEKLGETLGGFGEQLGGFGKQIDALGSFNEQVGGLGKQFEAVNNKLDSGSSIVQKFFFINSYDNENTLKKKTQMLEYKAFPEAIIKIFRNI